MNGQLAQTRVFVNAPPERSEQSRVQSICLTALSVCLLCLLWYLCSIIGEFWWLVHNSSVSTRRSASPMQSPSTDCSHFWLCRQGHPTRLYTPQPAPSQPPPASPSSGERGGRTAPSTSGSVAALAPPPAPSTTTTISATAITTTYSVASPGRAPPPDERDRLLALGCALVTILVSRDLPLHADWSAAGFRPFMDSRPAAAGDRPRTRKVAAASSSPKVRPALAALNNSSINASMVWRRAHRRRVVSDGCGALCSHLR